MVSKKTDLITFKLNTSNELGIVPIVKGQRVAAANAQERTGEDLLGAEFGFEALFFY